MVISILQGIVNICFSGRFRVEGDSMLPSLAHGESVLVVRTRFRWNRLRRGDVAVFEGPEGREGVYIKRVVGLPGEDLRFDGGRVYLDGELLEESYLLETEEKGVGQDREWFTGADEYFLLGDNRPASRDDSRVFGPVSVKLIKGKAWFRCWPPSRWRPLARK